MRTFKDNAGRDWTIAVNVDVIQRVRDLLKVDLLTVLEGELTQKLIDDPILLCNVVYVVCKPEADAKNVTDQDFGRSMAGDAIDAATTALLEELVDFFPRARRGLLATALKKLREVERKAVALAQAKIEGPELDRLLNEHLKGLGLSSGNAPASSDSTPAPTPSASLS